MSSDVCKQTTQDLRNILNCLGCLASLPCGQSYLSPVIQLIIIISLLWINVYSLRFSYNINKKQNLIYALWMSLLVNWYYISFSAGCMPSFVIPVFCTGTFFVAVFISVVSEACSRSACLLMNLVSWCNLRVCRASEAALCVTQTVSAQMVLPHASTPGGFTYLHPASFVSYSVCFRCLSVFLTHHVPSLLPTCCTCLSLSSCWPESFL